MSTSGHSSATSVTLAPRAPVLFGLDETIKCRSALDFIDNMSEVFTQTNPNGSAIDFENWRIHATRWKQLIRDGELDGTVDLDVLSQQQERGAHLIVLVHGYLGCSQDMRLIASHLCVAFPTYEVRRVLLTLTAI